LDSLEAVHERVTEKRRGRQYATEHLNLALFVRLAAEFQGFCRDLHEDAVLAIVADLDGVAGADIHGSSCDRRSLATASWTSATQGRGTSATISATSG
jgi:hypothetical protein